MMKLEKKVRCNKCRKTIGIIRDGKLEIDCPRCGTSNQWDEQGRRVRITGLIKKQDKK